ncbi:MAG: hypothetical protein OXS29_00450, partial [bacterium]|nr:hypothetical protein [bacterium]MDE0289758.1 hypothetical protein [bacterium]
PDVHPPCLIVRDAGAVGGAIEYLDLHHLTPSDGEYPLRVLHQDIVQLIFGDPGLAQHRNHLGQSVHPSLAAVLGSAPRDSGRAQS